jgi:fructose-specific PTS system IIA-like component
MPVEFTFNCPLANGIHARPASLLEGIARPFRADITLTNTRNGQTANAKSILSILSAEIRHQDTCVIGFAGPDEGEALAALSTFVLDQLARCDEDLPTSPAPAAAAPLPPVLRGAGATVRRGTAVVRGIGRGRLVWAGGLHLTEEIPGAVDPEAETRQLDAALANLNQDYEDRLARLRSGTESDLIKAHRAVARDPEFQSCLREAIKKRARSVAGAVTEAQQRFASMFAGSGNDLLRERTLDIQDVCFELLRQVYGKAVSTVPQLVEDSVLAAETLTPGQFLALNRGFLKGLVLGHAGATSHTVILARSFGVPTLIGVGDLGPPGSQAPEAVVDGDLGALVTDLTGAARRYFTFEERRLGARRAREARFAALPALTPDGKRLEVAANVSTAAEAVMAFAAGAEGIGIFRTEMLFLERETPPTEDEQFAAYSQAASTADGRPVVFRTLDIGGDKPLPYLNLPGEENPFLGYRAVRIYPEFEQLFRAQARALIRASALGKLKVILPMITTLDEARWVKQVIATEQDGCARRGLAFDASMEVGAMIEVPAAVFLIPELSREFDFFSLGTNDLLQYFAAADRANTRVAPLHDPLQPAFLRLLRKAVDDAHAAGKWIGLCGEMGGRALCVPLMIGLGLDEVSVVSSALAPLRVALARWPAEACRELTARALACATAGEVRVLLQDGAIQPPLPLIDPDLILPGVDCLTREEAVKAAVDQLYVLGRTEQPRAVEEAVWQREAAYSTGFGHGFAIPHCKTDAVSASSLVVVKLLQPVDWGSSDGKPVRVILLLAVRESDRGGRHLKVLAHLARKVMHEDFRKRLASEESPAALQAFLEESLGLGLPQKSGSS